jgi:hypothetical protein
MKKVIKIILIIKFEFISTIEKELLAPTLLSVRKKTLSNDGIPTEEIIAGDDEEEDPMVANLEQDEAETEAETQRKIKMSLYNKIPFFRNQKHHQHRLK